MIRLGKKNILEETDQYNISRRRGMDRVAEGQGNRVAFDLGHRADLMRNEASKTMTGGKDAWWLIPLLSMIPGGGTAAAAVGTVYNESKKRKQWNEHLSGMNTLLGNIPSYAKGTFLEQYARENLGQIGSEGLGYAKSARDVSNKMGTANIALSLLPMLGEFKGSDFGQKVIGKDSTLGKLGAKALKEDGLLDTLLKNTVGSSGLGKMVPDVTKPLLKDGIFPNSGSTMFGGVFPNAKSKFVGGIGTKTNLHHLLQGAINPLQKMLIEPPSGESVIRKPKRTSFRGGF